MDIINEIRERIKDRMAILSVARDDDEYANGQSVSLAIALRIIDEVEKEHPVPAEERKIIPKLREYLDKATPEELDAKYHELEHLLAPKDEDEDEAAEEACAKCPISGRCFVEDKGRKDACDYLRGVKAGIAYERERKMQRVGEEWGDKVAENPEIIFSTDGELTVYSFVGAPRWWATIREAEEALSVFKAGICWRKAQMEKRITLIQKSWYEQGKIDGKYEGLTDDEKYQQGAFDERERLMKGAIECNVIWYDGRLLDFTQEQLDAALDKIGAGVDTKVSVIIIKKEK